MEVRIHEVLRRQSAGCGKVHWYPRALDGVDRVLEDPLVRHEPLPLLL